MNPHLTTPTALDSARRKAYWHLLPLLFICYVIAYVDRANVGIAKLTMTRDLPGFDNAVIGYGAGMFFVGYFLLEIPSAVLIERWSARRLLTRIMVTWGFMAALTAVVKTPHQFYGVRFLLGLAEAGFFPGVIVYLSHWFPKRDRSKALAYFFIATPVAQLVSPKISNELLKIGTDEVINRIINTAANPPDLLDRLGALWNKLWALIRSDVVIDGINSTTIHHPAVLGLAGWQWVYIAWGLPAVLLGIYVFFILPDRPADAKWLSTEERDALEQELAQEKAQRDASRPRMTLLKALSDPKVLLLTLAYFCTVSASQGMELFLPSILQQWYSLKIDTITSLVMLPPLLALAGQLFVGWNSDRVKEHRLHTIIPVSIALISLVFIPETQGHLPLTIVCFMITAAGLKAYLPAFWTLPSLFLTEVAAASSIGLINSIGNLGGYYGQGMLGQVQKITGSFVSGLYYLCGSLALFIVIIFLLGIGHREKRG